jgi:hypothetical protein
MQTCLKLLYACLFMISCGQCLLAQGNTSLQIPVSVKPSTPFALASGLCPVIGEPYFAVTESKQHQTLADGTHIDHNRMLLKTYRDSAGRTRQERYTMTSLANNTPEMLIMVEISDPVAGVGYVLDPRKHTAREVSLQSSHGCDDKLAKRTALPAPFLQPRPGLPGPCGHLDAKPPVVEDLGTQVMEGLLVHGTRTTTTIPTCAQGNDRPFTTVSELWVSDEMKLIVLSKHFDPRYGESTILLQDLQRSEPDISLFQVPSDYTLIQ